MRYKIWDIIRIIFIILVIILSIYVIILLLIKIFGHSPSEITIISWVVGILLSLQIVIITILFKIKEDIGGIKEFKRQTIRKIKDIEDRL